MAIANSTQLYMSSNEMQ